MDSDRTKKAAQWYYENIFQEETIKPRPVPQSQRLPAPLRKARSLEKVSASSWYARESIFMKQARLLADYEDDYAFDAPAVHYYPTYQSLSDQELRGYFTWRTRLRKGDLRRTSLSFAFLYIYELINQIGVNGPMVGYQKLEHFRDTYGQLDPGILPYLNRWLVDYVVYYGLDPGILSSTPQVLYDRNLTILENIHHQDDAKVIYAVKELSPRWLERSKFYNDHTADCDTVILRVLRRVWDHYDHCKKGFIEQYFGACRDYPAQLFQAAVFCTPLKIRKKEYIVDERCIYRCEGGVWTVRRHTLPQKPSAKLGDLLKAIDGILREELDYGHPIKYQMDTKWIMKIIREEARALAEEKRVAEAKKITIDYASLDRIRRDAAVTREKLIVDEELEEEEIPEPIEEPTPAENDSPLTGPEYRLMQCLLYGRDLSWVQAEGYILSVLLDAINDKLYDTFLDTVADDTPAIVADYIDDLKEMIHP